MSRILFSEADAEEWDMLDVHDLVEDALEQADSTLGESDSDRVKRWLRQNDHDALVEYVESGEERDMHTGSTCATRDIWFDLGDLDRTPMLFPRFTWRVFRAIWNEANATANDQFYNVHTDHDEKVLCGILNSRLVWMFYELHGRTVGGEGMNRTEIKGYEIDDLPIPDIRAMSDDEKERIRTAFDALLKRERELGPDVSLENEETERDALDRAVLSAIGLEDRVDEIRRAVAGLLAMREQGGGMNTGVLVERTSGTIEDPEVIDLPGVSDARENTTIGDFE